MHQESLTCLEGKKQRRETMSNRKELLSVAKYETSGLEPQGHEGLDSLLLGRGKMMVEESSQGTSG